jgi:hypothetical protein
MKFKSTPFFEVVVGLLLVAIGFILWWWSAQLVWIQIYPQPLTKSLIESMPFAFWAIGVVLVMDGFRRRLRNNQTRVPPERSERHSKKEKRDGCAGNITRTT